MVEKKAPLKKLPGFSQGVRANAAVRMVKMAAPICPNSVHKYEKDRDGRLVPVAQAPNLQNCQLAGGEWWKDCEARGHNPYFSNRVWYTKEDVWETDEAGESILTGTKTRRHQELVPNVVQVASDIRHNSGQGVNRAITKKGRIRLEEIGYESPCQFRNCQRPVAANAKSVPFGNYCSQEHLALVAANENQIALLQITGLEGTQSTKAKMVREKQLREALAFSDRRMDV